MVVAKQKITNNYAIYNADNMQVLPDLKSNSIHCSVYSPPFPELYQYSNDPRDMSNCTSYEEGLKQYEFIVEQLHRLTMSGRVTCVHCMDLKKGVYQRDFPGDIIRIHEKVGFNFFSRITIWKDPWDVARRTRMRSLMHKKIIEDSSTCKVAGADYILIFKKSGENQSPVKNLTGLKTYAGATEIPNMLAVEFKDYDGDQRKNFLSHWIWRRYASCVWMDIRPGRLLPFKEARESEEEKHVCPLQLDVIERLLTLYSAKNENVLTPFMGVGSEAYMAVKMNRLGIGIELKETYYNQALNNLEHAKDDEKQITLDIDLLNEPLDDPSDEIKEED